MCTTADKPGSTLQVGSDHQFSGKYIFVNRSGIKVAEYSSHTLAQQTIRAWFGSDDNQLFDRATDIGLSVNCAVFQASKKLIRQAVPDS